MARPLQTHGEAMARALRNHGSAWQQKHGKGMVAGMAKGVAKPWQKKHTVATNYGKPTWQGHGTTKHGSIMARAWQGHGKAMAKSLQTHSKII